MSDAESRARAARRAYAARREAADTGSTVERDPSTDQPQRSAGDRGEDRVRAARVARHRRYADLQVEEAMRRGDFDALPGAGKPLQLGDRHDPNWWVKRLIAREQIEGTTPPAIALRLEDGRLDADLDAETSEREVRRRVRDFNQRVREARRQLTGGPPVITPMREEEVELLRWRERREARRAAAEADRAAREAEQQARRQARPAWRRWRRHSTAPSSEDGVGRAGAVGLVALGGLVVGAVLLVGGTDPTSPGSASPALPATSSAPSTSPTPSPTPSVSTTSPSGTDQAGEDGAEGGDDGCADAGRAVRPVSVTIPGVRRQIEVVRPPRDANGVPGTPPLTSAGKTQMAYDTAQGIAPGDRAGNALFNAHTWPDGSALGNELLDGLRRGSELRVRGAGDRELCYRLVRRVEVPATVSGAQYYRDQGPHRVAIVVCSGTRSADGAWSHRTLFFAAPRT